MMPCCDKDGYIRLLRWTWRFCVFVGLDKTADRIADRKRSALLARHGWMAERGW
jgi:hypothetical protein